MSVKIKLSYEHPHELETVQERLAPLVEHTDLQPPRGRYRLAYLHMRTIPRPLTGTSVRDKLVVTE